MPDLIKRITNLLDPLAEFYTEAGRAIPAVERLTAGALPQLCRELLVHDRDMTSTLESHYGDTLHLRVLGLHRDPQDETLNRQVVLETDRASTPVEFGAIQIHLLRFPGEAKAAILECHRPLGTIVAEHSIPYRSQPTDFFAIEVDEITRAAFRLDADPETAARRTLYGRHNVLTTPDGDILAEVVEILAPA